MVWGRKVRTSDPEPVANATVSRGERVVANGDLDVRPHTSHGWDEKLLFFICLAVWVVRSRDSVITLTGYGFAIFAAIRSSKWRSNRKVFVRRVIPP